MLLVLSLLFCQVQMYLSSFVVSSQFDSDEISGSKFYCVRLGPSSKDWEQDSERVHIPMRHSCSCGNRSFTQHRPSAFRQWPRGGRRISAELCCFHMICIFTSVNSFIVLLYLLFKCHANLTLLSSSCIATHFISCFIDRMCFKQCCI